MKTSKIYIYLYKTKIYYMIISLLILTATVQIVDFIELTQENISNDNFSFNDIILMSFLKMPFLINEILPFIIIISTSFYFKNLIDNNELISIRNLGLSIIDIFYPVAFAVLTLGLFALFFLNPISSKRSGRIRESAAKFQGSSGSTAIACFKETLCSSHSLRAR